jgi:TonB family protein
MDAVIHDPPLPPEFPGEDPRAAAPRSSECVIAATLRWGEQILAVRQFRPGERFIVRMDDAEGPADVSLDREHVLGRASHPGASRWVCLRCDENVWWVCPPPASEEPPRPLLARDELALGPLVLQLRRVTPDRIPARRGVDRAFLQALFGAAMAVGVVLAALAVTHPSAGVTVSAERSAHAARWIARHASPPPDSTRELGANEDHREASRELTGRSASSASPGASSRPSRVAPSRPPSRAGAPSRGTTGRDVVASRGIFAALGTAGLRAGQGLFDGLRGAAGTRVARGADPDPSAWGGPLLGRGTTAPGSGEGIETPDRLILQQETVGEAIGVEWRAVYDPRERAARVARTLAPRATSAPRLRSSGGLRVCGRLASGEAIPCASPVIDGTYSREAVRRVVLRNMGQIERCYEQALHRATSTEGRVSVRFVIGPEGAVLGAGIEGNDTGDEALGACMRAAVSGWSFSPPGSLVTVRHPFALRAP